MALSPLGDDLAASILGLDGPLAQPVKSKPMAAIRVKYFKLLNTINDFFGIEVDSLYFFGATLSKFFGATCSIHYITR